MVGGRCQSLWQADGNVMPLNRGRRWLPVHTVTPDVILITSGRDVLAAAADCLSVCLQDAQALMSEQRDS